MPAHKVSGVKWQSRPAVGFDHVAGRGVLSGRQRAGEPRRQIRRNHGAAFGHQRRRFGEIEIALNQNPRAIRPDKKEIAALADEISKQ